MFRTKSNNRESYRSQLTLTTARSVAPSANLIKFPPPIKLMVYMTINNNARNPHFELQPAPPKKHLKPNDQLEK